MSNGWSLLIYAGVVVFLVSAILVLSYVLGERHKGRTTAQPYESGILPTGSARLRISVKYYLIAMFFVIFDLEAAFLFAWAVALREVGWAGYVEVLVFVAILFSALVYLWRIGALDWATKSRKARYEPPSPQEQEMVIHDRLPAEVGVKTMEKG